MRVLMRSSALALPVILFAQTSAAQPVAPAKQATEQDAPAETVADQMGEADAAENHVGATPEQGNPTDTPLPVDAPPPGNISPTPTVTFGPHANDGSLPPSNGPTFPPYYYPPPYPTAPAHPVRQREWEPKEPRRSVWEVPNARGPVLTILGSIVVTSGAVVGGLAVGTGNFNQRTRDDERSAVLLASFATAGLGGGLLIAVGTNMWREDLGTAEPIFVDDAPRDSVAMVITGAVITGVGGFATLVGFGANFLAAYRSGAKNAISGPEAGGLIIGGGTTLAIGLPILLLGNRRLPIAESVEVSISPTGASLQALF